MYLLCETGRFFSLILRIPIGGLTKKMSFSQHFLGFSNQLFCEPTPVSTNKKANAFALAFFLAALILFLCCRHTFQPIPIPINRQQLPAAIRRQPQLVAQSIDVRVQGPR